MSDVPDLSGVELIHTEVLWVIQIRDSEDGPWVDYGTHKASWEDQLRVYEFHREKYPEAQTRMVRVMVLRSVEDPDKLKEILRQKAAEAETTDLQSN